MKLFKHIQLLAICLLVAVLSSCNNNDKVISDLIDEINQDADVTLNGPNGMQITIEDVELDGKDIIFSFIFNNADFSNITQDEIDELTNNELTSYLFCSFLEEFSDKETKAIVDGGYSIVFLMSDPNNNSFEIQFDNRDIRDYFEE